MDSALDLEMLLLQVDVPRSFNKDCGRVTLVNGDMIYSPNSSRPFDLSPYDPHRGQFTNIFDRRDARAELYHQPRWWTRPFGWVSFLPTHPSHSGPLFGRLAHVPTLLKVQLENNKDGFAMPPVTCEKWMRLEANLSYATSLLIKEYKIPAVRPLSPWAFGYTEGREKHQDALGRAFRARDWFQVWMGLLSYVIAQAETIKKTAEQSTWPNLLRSHGYDQTWIDALRSSTVYDFTFATPRAGAFLELQDVDEFQPEVAWFCHFGVPVWYRWGLEEANNQSIAHLSPLPHQLQEATMFMFPEPSMIPESTSSGYAVADGKTLDDHPREYVTFFKFRAERNKKRLLTETPETRQTRLNRERQRPTASTKVFVWECSGKDPKVWVRVPVRARDREETLLEYSESQRIYDAITNEWDVCTEFGKPDDDEEEEDNFPGDQFEDDVFDPSQQANPPYDNFSQHRGLTPPPQASYISDGQAIDLPHFHSLRVNTTATAELSATNESCQQKADLLQQEILEILTLFHGYIPPLPLPTTSSTPQGEAECKKLVRMLGLVWSDSKDYIRTLPVTRLAKLYLDNIASNQRPSDHQCDFSTRSRMSVALLLRFRYIRIVETVEEKPRSLYMFEFGKNSCTAWKLTMTTASNALLVCRLHKQLNEYDIVYYLVGRGIPFHTMLPSHLAPRGPREPPPPCVLPMRLSNAKFSRNDYDAYDSQRTSLLQQPRARAALLRGGYHWRMAAPIVSFKDVLQGPTGWNAYPGTMFTMRDLTMGQTFLDDKLTDVEMDIISGTYICHTHIFNQTATRSWFPLASTFEASGEDYGRWSAHSDTNFLRRVHEISDFHGQDEARGPLTAKKWRDLCRGMKETRRVKDNIERWSEAFIRQHLQTLR